MTAVTNQAIGKLLAKGVRNIWYPICPSHFLADKPISLRRLGLKLVLWRDGTGVAMLEDHCPHRGAPLSMGIPMGDRIACGYHGVRVRKDGTVMVVPGIRGSKLEGGTCVNSFPTEEHNGVIFGYFGDALHPEPIALQLPEQLASPDYSSFLCYCEWRGDYRYVYDHVMDPIHGTFLHRQSHSMSFGDTTATFRTRETPSGLVFAKAVHRNVD